MTLDPIQLRVLGSLIEKEIATPENYPLSLNALLNACNQRSSRDPVLALTEDQVRQALHTLEDLALVTPVRDSRVPKYEHRIRTVLNLRRDETAVLCLLMLRGPQTPGELRTRADRLYSFDDLAAVQSTLERLAARLASSAPGEASASGEGGTTTGPLTTILPRQPGSREARYAHLLGGPPDLSPVQDTHAPHPSAVTQEATRPASLSALDRLAEIEARLEAQLEAKLESKLEARLTTLSAAIETLKARLDRLESEPPVPQADPFIPL